MHQVNDNKPKILFIKNKNKCKGDKQNKLVKTKLKTKGPQKGGINWTKNRKSPTTSLTLQPKPTSYIAIK